MYPRVKLFSTNEGEIFNFLYKYYNSDNNILLDLYSNKTLLEWEKEFENPIELASIVGVFIDNVEDFKITMWISIDKGYFIKITSNNADSFIRYLYERYPY